MQNIEQTLYHRKRIYYQPVVGYFYRQRLEKMLKMAPLSKDSTVLDVGFEHGILLYKLSKHLPCQNIYGIELNAENADRTGKLFQSDPHLKDLTLIKGDILTHDFQGQQFDLIFATSVLEHIKPLSKACESIAHLLRPGGQVVVLSPHEKWHYALARLIFGYRKPADHYHDSDKITSTLSGIFRWQRTSFYPVWARLYKIDLLCKEAP